MYPLKINEKYNQSNLENLWHRYTTLYLGNYKSGDMRENVGSHCGVDIVPVNSKQDVLAVMPGIVFKSSNSGVYGNFVIIKHTGVPDPDNKSKSTNLFSCYLHLDSLNCEEGDNVKTGDTIGKTGSTGMSTGEHLHFQIDRDTAFFHPYWPFTGKDQQEAGLTFFEAVNEGLKMEEAKKHTVNPLVYLDEIEGNEGLRSVHESNSSVDKDDEEEKKRLEEEAKKAEEARKKADEEAERIKNEELRIKNEKEKQARIDAENKAREESERIKNEELRIKNEKEKERLAKLEEEKKKKEEKAKKDAEKAEKARLAKLEAEKKAKEESGDNDLSSLLGGLADIKEIEDGTLKIDNGIQPFTDVSKTDPNYNYLYELKKSGKLSNNKKFNPNNSISRAELLKMIFTIAGLELKSDDTDYFTDVPSYGWQKQYINSGVNYGFISKNNTKFRPNANISRIEAYKIILSAVVPHTTPLLSGEGIATNKFSIDDFDENHWSAKYINYIVENNLMFLENNKIYPNRFMKRKEVVNILRKLSEMRV